MKTVDQVPTEIFLQSAGAVSLCRAARVKACKVSGAHGLFTVAPFFPFYCQN